MTPLVWVIWVGTFASVALFTYGGLLYLGNRRHLRERLKKPNRLEGRPLFPAATEESLKHKVFRWLSLMGKWAALQDQAELSRARSSLIQAGYRHPNAPAIYFGLWAVTALLLPLLYATVVFMQGRLTSKHLLLTFILFGSGYFLPKTALRYLISRRQERLGRALPDVLDLCVVCMEAGLSLQAALNRVAEEIRDICRDFYVELQITSAELRTGIPRDTALKKLGQRTGVDSIKSWVALMIQSEKLGASIAQSLRTHAEFVRVQRALKAEESAAKLPVKILFPLIFFIFPALFVVILGPAVIKFAYDIFPQMMNR